MKNKLLGLSGTLSLIILLVGYVGLIQINPQIVVEFDLMALSFYNMEGLHGQMLAKWIIYYGAGWTSLILLIGLIIENRKSTRIIIGLIFLAISAAIWISFGFISITPEDFEVDSKLVLMRTILFILTIIVGFTLIGTDCMDVKAKTFIKWLTLSFAIIITILGSLSTFVFNDETYVRTNISLFLFFIWVGVMGTTLLTKKTKRLEIMVFK